MFKVRQVRLGLATNSSSSHRLIVPPPGSVGARDADGEFGWGSFVYASKAAKRLYAAVQLREVMGNVANDEVAEAITTRWTGIDVSSVGSYVHVDHQSRWTLPVSWDGQTVDKELFEAILKSLERDDVVVLDGNDNSDGHPLATGPDGEELSFEPVFGTESGGPVALPTGSLSLSLSHHATTQARNAERPRVVRRSPAVPQR